MKSCGATIQTKTLRLWFDMLRFIFLELESEVVCGTCDYCYAHILNSVMTVYTMQIRF